MKKIKAARELNIPGWGIIPKGTPLKVVRFNSRFVYAQLGKCEVKLARKKDVEVVY